MGEKCGQWYDENTHELFMEYGEYIESMKEAGQLYEMETLDEWLEEEWAIYQREITK